VWLRHDDHASRLLGDLEEFTISTAPSAARPRKLAPRGSSPT
jgi:hypothetical protein